MVDIKRNQYNTTLECKATKKINSATLCYETEKFDENIEKISPQFVKIYNQALQAEKIHRY